MATITFSIGSGISITLTDISGGVQVDVVGAGKDITAVFFDLNSASGSDNNALINTYTVNGSEVTGFDFEQNQINAINGVNLNPQGRFDAGVAIADTGSNFIGSTSFVVLGTGLTIDDFSAQRFGVRLSGNQGSSKIVGSAPTIDATAPTVAISLSDNALTSGETAVVTFTFSEAPIGFTAADITAENGAISNFSATTNPLVYTATFTPTVGISDTTNVIRVLAESYQDAAGNSGAAGISGNYTVNTLLFGSLTVESTGYVSQSAFPTSTSFNPVTNPIVIQPIENTAAFDPRYFILPEVGASFLQTIKLTTGANPTAPGTTVKINTTNSPLVVPDFVWNDTDNDNLLDSTELSSKVNFNGSNSLVYTFANSIAANSTVNLKVSSNIVDPNATSNPTLYSKEKITFKLQDQVDSDQNGNSNTGEYDLGAAPGVLTLYLTGGDGTAGTVDTGFRKAANSTLAFFNELAPSVLEVDVNADNTIEKSQSAEVVRAAGTVVEGSGGASPGTTHFVGIPELEFDVDQRFSGGGGTINSDPIDVTQFQLVWNAAPGINTAAFQTNSGPSAFNNLNGTANDSLTELIAAGLFDQIYAIDEFEKDGNTFEGQLIGTKNLPGGGTKSIDQGALAGDIGAGSLVVVNYAPPPNFQTFINNLPQLSPPNAYQINVTNPNIAFNTYSPTPNKLLSVIQLQSSSTTIKINITPTGNNSSSLDLSQTTITNINGVSIGANISGSNVSDTIIGSTGDDVINGGNGTDVLNGWLGDDVLLGSNGPDRFVFGFNSGSDTIGDLGGNDLIDVRGLNIPNPQSLDTNTNGKFDVLDNPYAGFASLTGGSLTLNFTPFSDAQIPNTVTTSKITFSGITEVSLSQFVFT